jgi:membrane protein implicated in regulation of membrane protease activity
MLAPISIWVGITAAIVLFVIIAVLLLLSTPSIIVTKATLKVGRATIERGFLGKATAYRGKDATAERGPRLNGLAFLCIRGWVDPVVRIEIEDPSDRTPYWLTSTRHPDRLLAALSS